jgi:hypothetical protein
MVSILILHINEIKNQISSLLIQKKNYDITFNFSNFFIISKF